MLVHDGRRSTYWEVDDPAEELGDLLKPEEYSDAMEALGEASVIDL